MSSKPRAKSACTHYAKNTAAELAERQRQTNEVKGVLNGEMFKQVKPKYTSKPDIQGAEISHQVLCHDFDKLNDHTRLYGKAANKRHLDPDMSTIMGWGEYDPPVKSDFINNKNAF